MAPAGLFASAVGATLCASAYGIARPARVASGNDAARRAALAFAFLGCFGGAAGIVACAAYCGPAQSLLLYGFFCYVTGALLVGPLAREGHRLAHRRDHDAAERLVSTAALVGTLAGLPSLALAEHDDDLALISAVSLGLGWLGCLWVISRYARSRRLIARIRAGRLAGYRLRDPATPLERRSLPLVFSGYGEDQPMETLVRVAEVPKGAYREAPIEEPLALVPALGARLTRVSPALVAVLVPTLQALLLLVMWSVAGT